MVTPVIWQQGQADKRARRAKRQARRPRKNMSDAARLYRAVFRHLNHLQSNMLMEHRITLTMMIVGLLRGRSGQFRPMAGAVDYPAKQESLIDRFRRFVANPNLEVAVEYAPFVAKQLQAVEREPQVVLLIDSTKIGGSCICLMVSLYYKSRALPLAWLTFKGKKGHSSQKQQLALFERVKALLPPDQAVILLGDGEFDGSDLVAWLTNQPNWQYACRTDRTNLVFYQNQWVALEQLPLTPGQETLFKEVLFTQAQQVGPVNILAVWHETEQTHWFFVTNLPTVAEAKAWYKKRFTIETLFSDLKGRGFHLADTRLWQSDRVDRLIWAGAIAYFCTVVLGVTALISRAFTRLVRTDAFYHSLFQLGLLYLNHLLNKSLGLPSLVNLPPPDTFEHVVIS